MAVVSSVWAAAGCEFESLWFWRADALAAGLLGMALKDAQEYGWKLNAETVHHDWDVLRDAVQDYIRGTNWGYKSSLRVRCCGCCALFVHAMHPDALWYRLLWPCISKKVLNT